MEQRDRTDAATLRNRETLDRLFAGGKIALRRSALFDTAPGPMPPGFGWERIEGMMLGLAIGDSLGNTSEGQLPHVRRSDHGEVRSYIPNRNAEYRPVGLPSDDTQMAFWTLDQVNGNGGLVPENLARRFASERIFGRGSAVGEFVRNMHEETPWEECAPRSAGNGGLMRIAPILILHIATGTADLWIDTALCARITHNDTANISACVAFVAMLWDLLQMDAPPEPEWWLERYVAVARDLEDATEYTPRGGAFVGWQGPLSRFVEEKVGQAYREGLSALEACDLWYSGAFLLETVPSVLYILMRHGHDPEEAIVRAVNDTKDNDSIAAIVGAAVGALHGTAALPVRWRENLLGRTGADDDGKAFQILEEARGLWGTA